MEESDGGSGNEEEQQRPGEAEAEEGEEGSQINEIVIEDPDALDVDLASFTPWSTSV